MPVGRLKRSHSIWRAEFLRPTETVVQFRLLAERGIHMAQKQEEDDRVRLDKWLWAARFKTRALAKAAIESGKVHCRGERCKPGKEPRVGDEFQIRVGVRAHGGGPGAIDSAPWCARRRRRCTRKLKPASPSAKRLRRCARRARWA